MATEFDCPYCERGRMVLEIVRAYPTRVGGVSLTVPNAQVSTCTDCGETAVSAGEMKRWEYQAQGMKTNGR